ncbi:SIR2 family protein [Nocardia barduliensis]|uniref:SIR2 family protein n=1 Tax=Nocardia barduliensis TaxID=2736643 RepID=UPI0015736CC0|nr:SIR2 family protein [Nocardia barduliensis]
MDQYDLVNNFGEAVSAGNGALFVGAGLSVGAGLPTWTQLLKPLQEKANVPDHHDYPLIAEYIANDKKNVGREALCEHILELIAKPTTPTRGHRLLTQVPLKEIWTTNYDELIEKACDDDTFVAVTDDDIRTIGTNNRTIIKMHGSVKTDGGSPIWAEPPVITRSDYEQYEFRRPRTWALLRAAYVSRTFLFLGFSFTDPNIEVLLRLARQHALSVTDRHLTVLKRPPAGPERILHSLRMKDLESSGVKVCEIDEYDELQRIIQALVRRTRPQRLFISGSGGADEHGLSRPDPEIRPWCEKIAAELASRSQWELTSLGGPAGWNITRDVANIRRSEQNYSPEKLTFYFRQKSEPPPEMQERVGTSVYTDLPRERLVGTLLDECRAILVIGGGDRTAEEIQWARERGVGVVPLAASGGAAHRDWWDHHDNPPELGGRTVSQRDWELLDDASVIVAARAAVRLLEQAMYEPNRPGQR